MQLSPVLEKVIKPNGNGFAGFTVLYQDGDFENYVLFFTQKTHAAVVAEVYARHQQWLETHQNQETNQLDQRKTNKAEPKEEIV